MVIGINGTADSYINFYVYLLNVSHQSYYCFHNIPVCLFLIDALIEYAFELNVEMFVMFRIEIINIRRTTWALFHLREFCELL